MLQFQGDQYTIEELKYIYSALMIVQVVGEDARMLVNLQDKTKAMIQMGEAKIDNPTSPPGKKK